MAICSSYSKSETARSPRTITRAPSLRAYSTRRPSKVSTFTFGRSATAAETSCARSANENRGSLSVFCRIATVTLVNSRLPRRMMSRCPFVIGSKVPG